MRRLLSTGILLSSMVSLTALADQPGFLGPNGNGVYLGISGGYHHTQTQIKLIGASTATSNVLNNGVMGGAYLGYAMGLSKRFILSLELDANLFSKQDLSTSVATQTVSRAAVQNNYGVSVMPGIAIGERSQVYLTAGLESGRVKVITSSGSSSDMLNKRLLGYDLGGGYALRIAHRFSVRLQYQHVWYCETKSSFNAINVTNHIQPQDNRFTAGLSYHFIV